MNVKERIKKYIEYKKISISTFEKSINASNGYINSISKSIGLDKISKIKEIYPELNLEWLLTNTGEMLNNTYSDKINAAAEPVTEDNPLSKLQQENEELKELVSILKDQNQLLKETIEIMKKTEKEQDNKERNRRGA